MLMIRPSKSEPLQVYQSLCDGILVSSRQIHAVCPNMHDLWGLVIALARGVVVNRGKLNLHLGKLLKIRSHYWKKCTSRWGT